MIVKNEAPVIGRCLKSVRPFIDSWVIVDTGSTDATELTVREQLRDIPGEYAHRAWRDFASNRNEALDLARPRAEFVLFMDADEELVVSDGFELPSFTADAYSVRHSPAGQSLSYYRVLLARSSVPWEWEGKLHEYLHCSTHPAHIARLDGLVNLGHFDSHQNQDHEAKMQNYIDILQRALQEEPGHPRYTFYLADTYRASDRLELALASYDGRVEIAEGSAEQRFWAAYQAGLIALKLRRSASEVMERLLHAHRLRPSRAEPLWVLARAFRLSGQPERGYDYACRADALPLPTDGSFIDLDVYEWRAALELALCAEALGNQQAATEALRRVVTQPSTPSDERESAQKKLKTLTPQTPGHARQFRRKRRR